MRLTNKLVDSVVTEVAGEDVLPLVRALKNRRNVSEFKLADKINTEVNRTRNMLYKLYQNNLVSFIRKKDKKKGWYIYYWTFRPGMVKYLYADVRKKKIETLNERLKREEVSQFFVCPNACIRLDFEQAFGFEFKCPECGQVMGLENNKGKVENIKAEITRLEKELKRAG